MSAVEGTRWVRRFGEPEQKQGRVIFLPHAGGSASYYRDVCTLLTADQIECIAIQYPGRQDRFGEDMVCSIEGYADRITEVVAGLDPTPTILFGHSMGALIGYSMLSRYPAELGCIHRFMASAHHPPGSSVSGPDDGPEPDEQYVAYLRRLGGFDERLLSDPAVLEVILPAVRNDLMAVSGFWNKDKAKVQVPIVAITGMEDPTTDSAAASGWAELTCSDFHLVQVPGGHFYFSNEPERLTSVIMYTLMKAGGSRTT